jgi:hypothetical protein
LLSTCGLATTEFKRRFPEEKQYRHTLTEETEALQTAASLIDVVVKRKSKEVASDADIVLLKRLYDAKMIGPYVLLSAPDREIAADYVAYRDLHRDQLEQCLSDFIVPAVAVKH